MTRVELRLEHYKTIRDFMQDIELAPGDEMSREESEALSLVNQIISNIEKRRAQPARPQKYRKRVA